MPPERYTPKERRILSVATRLAHQIGGVFHVDPTKLADFRRREAKKEAE